MHEVVKEYGPALIAVIAIIALVSLIVTLIGTNGDSVVGKAFAGLINTFFENANAALKN
jgi:hypothetical protein